MRIYVHSSNPTNVTEASASDAVHEVVPVLEGSVLWAEDANEPLTQGATVGDITKDGRAAVHVGGGRVEVSVSYNGRTITEQFGPGSTVAKVLQWAVSSDGFDIAETDAATLQLRVNGTVNELTEGTHIGTLTGDQRSLRLDLLPGERFAG